jgi:hypothetical protein
MIKTWLKNIARVYLPVYQYESESKRIIYAGYSTIKKNYYVRFLLGNDSDSNFLGRYWYKKIPDLMNLYHIDMGVVEASRTTIDYFQDCNGYVLPIWINGKINIDRPFEEIINHNRYRLILKKISSYNLTYDIVTDHESFKDFTDHFYLPFISKRHGNEAYIEDLNELWKTTPELMIMRIKENGITVGMSLFRKSGEQLFLLRVGLLNGNTEYRQHGVIGATYYFSIIEGQKTGCKLIDLGGSRPFLTDGVTCFKKGLGAEFVSERSNRDELIWFTINEKSSAATEFVKNNPFMFFTKDFQLVSNES